MSTQTEKTITDKEVLLAAAQRLKEFGWVRHNLRNEKGACCIAGAINIETLGHEDFWPRDNPFLDSIPTYDGQNFRCMIRVAKHLQLPAADWKGDDRHLAFDLVDWNNQAERTAEHIINALEDTANALPEETI